jgi:hypothetical protein
MTGGLDGLAERSTDGLSGDSDDDAMRACTEPGGSL